MTNIQLVIIGNILITCTALIGAAVLAYRGKEGWGWLVFCALFCSIGFTGLKACKLDQLQAFANLIRKDQIEIDAGICEAYDAVSANANYAWHCAGAIRNQGMK